MLTSVHLVTGAAIGKATGQWWLTIPLAFISHYFLDVIPHCNQKPVKNYLEKGYKGADKKDLILKSIEPIIGLAFIIYFASIATPEMTLLIILGSFFGWLPDFLVFLKWKYNLEIRPKILQKIEKNHKHTKSFIVGIIPQIIIFCSAIFYLILY